MPEVTPAVLQPMPSLQPQEVRRDDVQTPPQLASSFETFAGAIPVALEASVPSAERTSPQRRHRIADGDTLESIAERYLGTRSEWRSIFAHNDRVLTDPAILPIGEEIRIPPTSTTSSLGDDRLVPIPPGLLNRE
jgi:nucleoid-associated protein YgaU